MLAKRKNIPFAVVGADGRFILPPGAKLLPCPECKTETGHTAECSLAVTKENVYWLCVALPIDLMRTDASGGEDPSDWPTRVIGTS